MTLQLKIQNDLKKTLKEKNVIRRETLRLLLAAIYNREIEKKGKGEKSELNDDEFLVLIQKEIKKRKEAVELYKKNNRDELVKKEEAEMKVLEEYQPTQLNKEEILGIINETIALLKPQSMKDFGKVMGEVMKKVKGRADASFVSAAVKEALN